jgi:AraC-like DNA-binding protein
MYYHEFQPHPDLKDYVNCYWIMEAAGKSGSEVTRQFTSDGGMELSFNLGDPLEDLSDERQPVPFDGNCVIGALTRSLRVRPTGGVKCFGVRFHPGGAYPFFPMPAIELANHTFDLEDIWGTLGRRLTNHMQDGSVSTADRIRALETYLRGQLNRNGKLDPVLGAAVQAIQFNKGQITVDRLAQYTNLSNRQLERKFNAMVGLTPKQLCRIVRFRYVFKYLARNPGDSWTSVAQGCGFYDQSHLIHEFKFFTGFSPQAYFKLPQGIDLTLLPNLNHQMSDFSNTI